MVVENLIPSCTLSQQHSMGDDLRRVNSPLLDHRQQFGDIVLRVHDTRPERDVFTCHHWGKINADLALLKPHQSRPPFPGLTTSRTNFTVAGLPTASIAQSAPLPPVTDFATSVTSSLEAFKGLQPLTLAFSSLPPSRTNRDHRRRTAYER